MDDVLAFTWRFRATFVFAHMLPAAVALFRRGAMVLFCALTFLLAVIPAHSAIESTVRAESNVRAVLTAGEGSGQETRPDSLPCHGTGHLCGQLAPLRPLMIAESTSFENRAPRLEPAPAHALVPGPSELPTKPPRK